jgi:hypothetical protein
MKIFLKSLLRSNVFEKVVFVALVLKDMIAVRLYSRAIVDS